MKNQTFRKTICKSKIWNDWIKHQEKKMEWDVHESTECGWLSEEHWEAFIEWVKSKAKPSEDTTERFYLVNDEDGELI